MKFRMPTRRGTLNRPLTRVCDKASASVSVHVNINQRFESTTAFLAQLQRVRRSVPDWHVTTDGLEMWAGQHRRKLRELRPHVYEVLKPWGCKTAKRFPLCCGIGIQC